MAFFSSSPVSGREEALYIGGPFTKVVMFDLTVAVASIRWELYGQENISRRIVARQTLWSLLSSPGFFGWFGILYI